MPPRLPETKRVSLGFCGLIAVHIGAVGRRRAPVLTLIHPFSTTEPLLCTSCELPASRGPGDGVGKGAVLRVFFEGFGWATGHVQKVTRDGAVDVFWVSDASYSTITRSVAAAHVVLPALVSAPMHALASKNGVVGCRGL